MARRGPRIDWSQVQEGLDQLGEVAQAVNQRLDASAAGRERARRIDNRALVATLAAVGTVMTAGLVAIATAPRQSQETPAGVEYTVPPGYETPPPLTPAAPPSPVAS